MLDKVENVIVDEVVVDEVVVDEVVVDETWDIVKREEEESEQLTDVKYETVWE